MESSENFWKGTSSDLLKALHILTRDGKLNADSRRKLKQVYHLTQLIEPSLKKLIQKNGSALTTIVDMGAGKSYLGFILYDLLLQHQPHTQIISIESREELMKSAAILAKNSGFSRMKFIAGKVAEVSLDEPVSMVCALHACDTATDDAILFGIKNQAQAFALVPCCQAEVAAQLSKNHPLTSHPLHKREFGSHLTNVIRCLYLNSLGYKVTVTELVGWEHSMKNEFILAEKISNEKHPESIKSLEVLKKLLTEYSVKPKLVANLL